MNIKKNLLVSRRILRGIVYFHYNIRADPLLRIDYISVRSILCKCSECLSKMDSLCNRRQDKCIQYQCKGSNQNCVYCPILGSHKKWRIIHCIYGRKQN